MTHENENVKLPNVENLRFVYHDWSTTSEAACYRGEIPLSFPLDLDDPEVSLTLRLLSEKHQNGEVLSPAEDSWLNAVINWADDIKANLRRERQYEAQNLRREARVSRCGDEEESYPELAARFIGNEPFRPLEQNDRAITNAAAQRLRPLWRVTESGEWLLRGSEKWVPRGTGDSSAYQALTELADFVPATDEHAGLRTKLTKHTTVTSLATMMTKRATMVGGHLYVSDEEIYEQTDRLWAGGVAYDLQSGQVDTRVSTDEVHIHSAGRRAPAAQDEYGQIDQDNPLTAYLKVALPDSEVRAYFLRLLGASLTGRAPKLLPYLKGEYDMAKTTVMQVVLAAIGGNQADSSYGLETEDSIMTGGEGQHRTFLHRFRGKRIILADEAPNASKESVENLKRLTGGSSLTANKMRQDAEGFSATWVVFMNGNEYTSMTDPAFRSRIRPIPWGRHPDEGWTYTEAARKQLAELRTYWGDPANRSSRAYAKLPVVLAILMSEAKAYLADPESIRMERAPEGVQAEMAQIRSDQDPLAECFTDCFEECDPEHDPAALTGGALLKHINQCLKDRGLRFSFSQQKLAAKLRDEYRTETHEHRGRRVTYALKMAKINHPFN